MKIKLIINYMLTTILMLVYPQNILSYGLEVFLDGSYTNLDRCVIYRTIDISRKNNTITFIINSCAFTADLLNKKGYWEVYLRSNEYDFDDLDDIPFDGGACDQIFNNFKGGTLIMTIVPLQWSIDVTGHIQTFIILMDESVRQKAYILSQNERYTLLEYFTKSEYIYVLWDNYLNSRKLSK